MAIQDDNTIVTKGDLKALYTDKIAPYLGANMMMSTNVSDYYSTDEKVVGVWTNGKPLYQKSFIFSNMTVTGTQQNFGNISGMNLEYAEIVRSCLDENGYWTNPGILCVWVRIPENNFGIINVDNHTRVGTLYFTLQYTKTTDAAGSATTTPGAYDINFPNTWPENTEIYFGNGLYGYRKTGTVTAASDERNMITIATNTGGTIGIVSSGGWIKWGDEGSGNDYKYSINSTLTNLPGWGSMLGAWSTIRTVNSSICLWNATGLVRTNAPYDIWVTYTKQG